MKNPPFFFLNPHALTSLRLFTGPLFFILYTEREFFGLSLEKTIYILFFVFLLSELSDLFDGFLARKYGITSELGKILDPMADSISRISFFLAFTTFPTSVPLLFILPMFYRDILISTLRILCGLSGFALAARPFGKFKAVLQASMIFAILLLIFAFTKKVISLETLQKGSSFFTGLAALFSVFSGLEYLIHYRAVISHFLVQNQKE